MSNLISKNLNMIFKTPKGETVHALKDLNFTIKEGELLTVLGPSGCGKTTLLNITAGFIRPTSGIITLGDKEINGPDQIVKAFKYDYRLLIKKWGFKLFVPSRKDEFNELICRTYLVGSIINKDFFSEAVKYYKFILKGEGKENPSFEDIRINMVKLIF